MKHPLKKAAAFLLAAALLVQGLPLSAFAAGTSQGFSPGKELFEGEEGQTRQYVSETAYDLAPGVTEYVTYTNVKDGTNQNIDYFCEVDLSQAKIMAGYSGMENILENQTINWRMQTVSDQVKDAQAYFTRAEQYADSTIVAALNADYYNMATGQPTGALIIDGHSYNPVNGRYYFGITEEGQAVISNSEDTEGLAYAVGGGTLLVKEGKVNVSKGGRNVTYTAIGIKADGTVVSMVCYGQRYPVSCGYTQYEVAQMMKARGCQTALLLDGSSSSTFVSRREGDSQVITRNNPSDGQERQVSSSIFIISDVKATGEFDHAVITPVNEVYTPRLHRAVYSGGRRPLRRAGALAGKRQLVSGFRLRLHRRQHGRVHLQRLPGGSHGVPAKRRQDSGGGHYHHRCPGPASLLFGKGQCGLWGHLRPGPAGALPGPEREL